MNFEQLHFESSGTTVERFFIRNQSNAITHQHGTEGKCEQQNQQNQNIKKLLYITTRQSKVRQRTHRLQINTK